MDGCCRPLELSPIAMVQIDLPNNVGFYLKNFGVCAAVYCIWSSLAAIYPFVVDIAAGVEAFKIAWAHMEIKE